MEVGYDCVIQPRRMLSSGLARTFGRRRVGRRFARNDRIAEQHGSRSLDHHGIRSHTSVRDAGGVKRVEAGEAIVVQDHSRREIQRTVELEQAA